MHRSRYAFGLPLYRKDVLEVACGAGIGLGYLLKKGARLVVGAGDYSRKLTRMASSHYRGELPLLQLDAQRLPFRDQSFDVLLMLEAIYYLKDAGCFVSEAARVLRRRPHRDLYDQSRVAGPYIQPL